MEATPLTFVTEWLKPYAEHLEFIMTLDPARWAPSAHAQAVQYTAERPYMYSLVSRLQCLQHLPNASWRPAMLYIMHQLRTLKRHRRATPLWALTEEAASALECAAVCMAMSNRMRAENKAALLRALMTAVRGFCQQQQGNQQLSGNDPLVAAQIQALRQQLRARLQQVLLDAPTGAHQLTTHPRNLAYALHTQNLLATKNKALGRAVLLMWWSQSDVPQHAGGQAPTWFCGMDAVHILPPQPAVGGGAGWLEAGPGAPAWTHQSHAEWLNRLGNCCLLPHVITCRIKNFSFTTKQGQVLGTDPETGRPNVKPGCSKQVFEDHQVWDVAACNTRGQAMAQLLVEQRWQLAGEITCLALECNPD